MLSMHFRSILPNKIPVTLLWLLVSVWQLKIISCSPLSSHLSRSLSSYWRKRMRTGQRTGQCEKQLFGAGEIPTWQWLWSVFPALTWDGFGSSAARLNLDNPAEAPPRDRCDLNSPLREGSTCRWIRKKKIFIKKEENTQVREDGPAGHPLRLQLEQPSERARL